MTQQPDLFAKTIDDTFAIWVHTPAGGDVANRFIRLAIGLHRRGFKHFGAKAICERLRWFYAIRRSENEDYLINNNYTSRLARFAEERVPEINGLFVKRMLKS